MKLEREPVFGQITLGHKPDPKSFDYNDISHDSNGVKSGNITKETQNRQSDDLKDNEKDATQLLYLVNDGDDLAASKLNLKTCKDDQVKDFVAPFAKSSLELESEYYTDKSVTECEMPEFQVCYRESSYSSVKDIAIDEGVPVLDRILFESGTDNESLCTFMFPDQDQNPLVNKGKVDIRTTSPNGLKSPKKNESEKEFVNVLESEDLMFQGEGDHNATDKIENDTSKEKIFPENLILRKELGREKSHSWSPNWDGDAAALFQISSDKASEKTQTMSPGFYLAAEKISNSTNEALAIPVPVSEAKESKSGSGLSNDLAYNGKVEKGRITFDFGSLASATLAKEECPQNGVSECLETENMSSIDDVTTNLQFVSSQVQHDSLPTVVIREECDQTASMPMVEDATSDTQNVSSKAQHELSTGVETPNGSSVNDGTKCTRSTDTECRKIPETPMVVDGMSGTETVSGRFQYGPGESSFSAAGPMSGRITYSGPITYSGSISLRSDSSTTSTRSFAFPVLQSEWNSSPVRMAKADQRHFRKHRGWRQGLLCCRF